MQGDGEEMEGDGGRCDFRGDVGWRGMELELGMVGAKTGSQGMEGYSPILPAVPGCFCYIPHAPPPKAPLYNTKLRIYPPF